MSAVVAGTPTDYYSLLGLPRFRAKTDEIRRAYRRVVKLVHPDVLGGDTKELTGLVMAAYQTLSDDSKRACYDEELAEALPASGPDSASGTWSWKPARFDASAVSDEDKKGLRRSSWSHTAPPDARGVFVDETQCVICFHCIECAPETFEMDTEGTERAHVVLQYGDSAEDVDWALKACPTQAISYVSREDLPLLEDLIDECTIEQPHTMMRRRMHGNGWAATPPRGPYELLGGYKSGAPMSRDFRARHGHHGAGAQRSASKKHNANAVAVSIQEAIHAVPEAVRSRVWPDTAHLAAS